MPDLLSRLFDHRSEKEKFDEIAAKIRQETLKARSELALWIDNPEINSVGCIDGLTKKGIINPPGGLIFLFNDQRAYGGGNYQGLTGSNDDLLERFVSSRANAGVTDGVLMAHQYCLYMTVILGADNLSAQNNIIEQAEKRVGHLNALYRTNFRMGMIEAKGSAKPYMKR